MVAKFTLTVALVLLTGCAAYEPPAPARDHPANPDASPGMVQPLPETLRIDESDLPSAPPEMQQGDAVREKDSAARLREERLSDV